MDHVTQLRLMAPLTPPGLGKIQVVNSKGTRDLAGQATLGLAGSRRQRSSLPDLLNGRPEAEVAGSNLCSHIDRACLRTKPTEGKNRDKNETSDDII